MGLVSIQAMPCSCAPSHWKGGKDIIDDQTLNRLRLLTTYNTFYVDPLFACEINPLLTQILDTAAQLEQQAKRCSREVHRAPCGAWRLKQAFAPPKGNSHVLQLKI
jgi:hypothetical protein